MTEEPQLGSIQQRIAALKQSQVARPDDGPEPFLRPATERSNSANNPPSYNVTGSVLDRASIGNEPADDRPRRPVPRPPSHSSRPDVKPKPKVPPPVPSRKSEGEPPPTPARPADRPALPPRRPTDPPRRPSLESVTSDASYSTASTTGRGTSTTSVNTNGNSRVKAPAWGTDDLPPLPPRRTEESKAPQLPSRPKSRASIGSLSSKLSLTSRGPSPSPPSLPTRRDRSPAPPQLPPRTTSGTEMNSNGATENSSPNLPPRKLPPPPSATKINDARQLGFGNKNPRPPPRSNSTPAQESAPSGVPPPIPHGSRPDLSKLQATKPRFHGSMPSATPPANMSSTECLICRDFSGPDNHAARYPRASLPTQDMGWLANELTAPFPSLTDKARAIFTWLHHNIFYDVDSFFNNCVQPSTPASTLATGMAVCEGYAGLFAALATHGGLEVIVITGHGKGFGHQQLARGSPLPPFNGNHAWNAVRIDGGRWKLIDACWGAGVVQGKGHPYHQRFEPAMFYISNDEFGLKHYPSDKNHFFREDGRAGLSWEEYVLTDPERPTGVEPLIVYGDAKERSIGHRSFQPAGRHISLSTTPSPIRFQFGLICEHWTLAHHSRTIPGLFLLMIHGVDGRKDDRLPFNHVQGSGPAGGGEFWYVDVPDVRMLGAPGQKLQLAVLTSFGDRKDARGVTAQEYKAQVGRVGMAWAYVAEWDLVQ
ncbi:hypothetical protein NUU61_004456 [Penicillium alfredii]|uniref:Transglutaminase-like domain-containing protein n=1 Tax=Penicillium alfredii TaxID=1506179 RepID=A0A9W9FL45_9EURO|nr:uncharacterized protein NUU61_004456 [Penicillium alfredii]KAJ5102234.1 hypothetical protein NUU61_004456 [Penicillium alfredii]